MHTSALAAHATFEHDFIAWRIHHLGLVHPSHTSPFTSLI
jgi:hypothetical protein